MRLDKTTWVSRVAFMMDDKPCVAEFHASCDKAIVTNGREFIEWNNIKFSEFTKSLRLNKIPYKSKSVIKIRGSF